MCLKAYSGLIGETKALAAAKLAYPPWMVHCFIQLG